MKMVLAIMPNQISEDVSKTLLDSGFRVTKFASTGGLFAGGTTTLMIGADDKKVEECLSLIRDRVPPADPTDSAHARVTIYVLKVKDFARIG
jgi:uncharacterized protein YaaQ